MVLADAAFSNPPNTVEPTTTAEPSDARFKNERRSLLLGVSATAETF
jgi:hypothetical protein